MSTIPRLKGKAIGIAVASLLIVGAFVWLALAAFFGLMHYMEPEWAALVTAVGCLVVALIVIALVDAVFRPPTPAPPPKQERQPDDILELALQSNVDSVVRDWVREHPDRAALSALALGVAVGSSKKVRQGLWSVASEMLKQ